MNYSLYKIYLNNTIELSRTMVIKLDWVARAMNQRNVDYGLPIPDDCRDWRYYKHLSGQYHEMDEQMMITSLDDSSEIVFSRENLKRHKKTRSVYLYNRTYVDALKQKYPEQTNLIWGILHPVDINVAINAADGTVLWYDTNQVEPQEHRLIAEIEDWVKSFLYRYIMESLVETDDLYLTTMFGQMYSFLPVKIMDIRDKYVKTSQTHSFHIMAYLASNQRLDEFVPYLTLSQMLFLYRNILYIERHTGMQDTFDLLVENLLTARNLPLYDYTLRQKDMDVGNGQLSPVPAFVKNQLNLRTGLSSRDLDEWDIDDVLYKEMPLARDNHQFYTDYIRETEDLTSMSSISNLPTKVLEVSAIDPDDIAPIKLIDTILNEWMHMSCTKIYTSRLEIINPLNGDLIKLDPIEMFLLYIYAHMAGFHGIHMETIPTFIAKGVQRKRWINDDEYLNILHHDPFDGWDDELEFYAKTAHEIYNDIMTPEDFLYQCLEITKSKSVRHQHAFQPHRHTDRTGRRAMYNYTYTDVLCDMTKEHIKTYHDFFIYVALDREMMSIDAWKDLAMQALDNATMFGTMNKISLKEIQAAMVRLFRRLSSYSVQFIEEIVGGEVTSTEPLSAIIGDSFEIGEAESNMTDMHGRVMDTELFSKDEGVCELSGPTITRAEIIDDKSFDSDLHVKATIDESSVVSFKAIRPAMSVRSYKTI